MLTGPMYRLSRITAHAAGDTYDGRIVVAEQAWAIGQGPNTLNALIGAGAVTDNITKTYIAVNQDHPGMIEYRLERLKIAMNI